MNYPTWTGVASHLGVHKTTKNDQTSLSTEVDSMAGQSEYHTEGVHSTSMFYVWRGGTGLLTSPAGPFCSVLGAFWGTCGDV